MINQWTQKMNIPGPSRDDCAYFTAYNKGYVGLGNDGGSSPKSLWEYTPDSACVTGIAEVENYKLEILIAPNPATEFILVSFLSDTSKDVELTIEDSNARIIYSKRLNLSIETSVKISLSDFSNGIYILKAKQAK
ncbi:MAG: T9SS type A sorting domain-containing protein [Bacteroidetes bacterium]|nr:T9SS type A sorting domain-containing protein [Bacteroidota bacterium]